MARRSKADGFGIEVALWDARLPPGILRLTMRARRKRFRATPVKRGDEVRDFRTRPGRSWLLRSRPPPSIFRSVEFFGMIVYPPPVGSWGSLSNPNSLSV